MYRTLVSRVSRPLASSSRSELHTSAVCYKASKSSASKDKDEALRRLQRQREREALKDAKSAARTYTVLGSKPGDGDKWPSCELARMIITEEKLYPEPKKRGGESVKTAQSREEAVPLPDMDGTLTLDGRDPGLESPVPGRDTKEPRYDDDWQMLEGGIRAPRYFNYGVAGGGKKKMLFKVLPALSAEKGATEFDENTIREAKEAMAKETQKANMFAKLVDLRNANAKGLAYENRRRIIARFSTWEQPNDTGRPEVQAALLTLQIRNVWAHLVKSRKDIANRRGLRKLVHQRAKVLRYLKRLDLLRYEALLPQLGLEPGSVEGELIV
ncbi:mitochondrial ribosomal protein S15 [Phlebopus sp. FC_14]|nr:mitochondrial ribosomal protein S15 [Phlebopus sp. FC_14]